MTILVGTSHAWQRIRKLIEKCAEVRDNVLLTGETGTGKRLIAEEIHRLSSRRLGPFVSVVCPAVTESLFEAELFGYEKGAFTDARERRKGYFELADGGTILLDEIGELAAQSQAKILGVCEQQRFYRIGGRELVSTDVRLIAATNVDLGKAVAFGHFRQDLYHRLNVARIRVPALRERPEDIPLLVGHCLQLLSQEYGRPVALCGAAEVEFLCQEPWPGNVRELFAVLRRAVLIADGSGIGQTHLCEALVDSKEVGQQAGESEMPTLQEGERILIRRAMAGAGQDKVRAARTLGIHPSTLYRKLKAFEDRASNRVLKASAD